MDEVLQKVYDKKAIVMDREGIESAKLQDGNFVWFTIDGKSHYCLVKRLSDAYIVCAASKEDIFVISCYVQYLLAISRESMANASSLMEAQSYEFGKLIRGVDYVIQEVMLNDIESVYTKYIGVSVKNAEHETEGLMQIAVEPELFYYRNVL